VFANKALRRIFGPKRKELTMKRKKIHIEELTDLYYSPNIIGVIKLRRMRGAGHVARMGKGEVQVGFWQGNLRERDHLEGPGVD